MAEKALVDPHLKSLLLNAFTRSMQIFIDC